MKKKLAGRDIMIITQLWSIEVVHVLVDAGKSWFVNRGDVQIARAKTVDINTRFFSSRAVMFVTIFVMLTIAGKTLHKFRLTILFVGLVVFVGTPICGAVLSFSWSNGLFETMIWSQIGWYAACPLRFWVIFKQKYPVSVKSTRKVATLNEIIIAAAHFVSGIISIKHTAKLVIFSALWGVLGVILVGWIVLLFGMRKKFNRSGEHIEDVQQEYAEEGAEHIFTAKQTNRHVIIFLFVLFPSMAFGLMKSACNVIAYEHNDKLTFYAKFRLDLIITVVFVGVSFVVIPMLKCVRQEIRDLVPIAVGHFLNVFAVALVFGELLNVTHIQTRSAKNWNSGHSTLFLQPYSQYDRMNFRVDGTPVKKLNDHVGYYEWPHYFTGKSYISAELSNGTELFSFIDSAEDFSKSFYLMTDSFYRVNNGHTATLKRSDRVVWALSALKPCAHRSPQDSAGRTWFENGTCHSLNVNIRFKKDENGSEFDPVYHLLVPHRGDGPQLPIAYPSTAKFHEIEYYVDGVTADVVKHAEKGRRHFQQLIVWIDIKNGKLYSQEMKVPSSYEQRANPGFGEPESSKLMLMISMSLAAAGIGMSAAPYMNYLWIQSPWIERPVLLSVFFSVNFFGVWYTRNNLQYLYEEDYQFLLFATLVGFVWHLVVMFVAFGNLRKLSPGEKKYANIMPF